MDTLKRCPAKILRQYSEKKIDYIKLFQQRIFDVNILGMYDVTLAFLPLIRPAGEGRIVNMSSMGGRITNGIFAGIKLSIYCNWSLLFIYVGYK